MHVKLYVFYCFFVSAARHEYKSAKYSHRYVAKIFQFKIIKTFKFKHKIYAIIAKWLPLIQTS